MTMASNLFSFLESENYHRIILFSPHLDDAVFGCGGLLFNYPQKERLMVVSVATKDAPSSILESSTALQELVAQWKLPEERRREDGEAMAKLGIDYKYLDCWDAIFRTSPEGRLMYLTCNDRITGHPQSDQPHIDRLHNLMRPLVSGPEKTLVLSPSAVGLHIDHTIVATLLRDLWREMKSFDLMFYEDFPYGLIHANPAMALTGGDDNISKAFERLGGKIKEEFEWSFDIQGKLGLCSSYASQVGALFGSNDELISGMMSTMAPDGRFIEWYYKLDF
jgi:LmbE family N-acetylglucosaminyl deacetylase